MVFLVVIVFVDVENRDISEVQIPDNLAILVHAVVCRKKVVCRASPLNPA